jgi:ZIP family zinc transporter
VQPIFTPLVYGIVFSMVGGMMVFIVCHELLPAAHRYMGDGNKATGWFLLGMIVMAASLVLFTF